MSEPQRAEYYPVGSRATIGILVAALVLAYFSVRSAIQEAFVDSNPAIAQSLWPADGASLASLAQQRIGNASGDVDEAARTLYRGALLRAPLLSTPLSLAGLDASAAGDVNGAARLMAAARGRDPRSEISRIWLFDHYMRTAQYGAGLDEVGPVIHLRPDAVTAVMTVLGALSQVPEGRAALHNKLAGSPFWRVNFFQTAAASSPTPQALLALLRSLPPDPDAEHRGSEQKAVFMALINANQGPLAYASWRDLLPGQFRSRVAPIYDGNFAGWPGSQPFNWRLTDDPSGVARTVGAGDIPQSTALEVRYFGSSPGTMVQQYATLSPGAHQFRFFARRRSNAAPGGTLSFEVRCLSGASLLRMPMDPLGPQLRQYGAGFVVPDNCPVQRVLLNGQPGEVFSETEAQITGVAVSNG